MQREFQGDESYYRTHHAIWADTGVTAKLTTRLLDRHESHCQTHYVRLDRQGSHYHNRYVGLDRHGSHYQIATWAWIDVSKFSTEDYLLLVEFILSLPATAFQVSAQIVQGDSID